MAFSNTPGFVKTPGMTYEAYRFNISGANGYFVLSGYNGDGISNTAILSAVKNAVAGIPGVTAVQVVKYEEVQTDVTSTL